MYRHGVRWKQLLLQALKRCPSEPTFLPLTSPSLQSPHRFDVLRDLLPPVGDERAGHHHQRRARQVHAAGRLCRIGFEFEWCIATINGV